MLPVNWNDVFHSPWIRNPSASDSALEALVATASFPLPAEYLDLLRWSNGGEGPIGEVYFTLWGAEDVLGLNEGYKFGEALRDVFVVGDDSAHFYALVFDQAVGSEAVRFPVGFIHPSAIDVRRPNLSTLLIQLAKGELF
jgi:hypothetical protein